MSKLKLGAILSYISLFVNLSIALLYTPFLLRTLTQQEYGLYTLIGPILAYFNVFDMGLGNAVVRYVSRNRAIGDKNQEARINTIFLLLYILIGIVVATIGIIMNSYVDRIFGDSFSEKELSILKGMITLLIMNFAVSFPLAIFSSIMQAYEKFAYLKTLSIIRYLALPLFTVPGLLLGYGPLFVVTATVVINIVCLSIVSIYCFKFLQTRFILGKLNFKLTGEITIFSLFIFLNVIVDLIYWNSGQFVLGSVSSTMAVAIFGVSIQFVKLYMMFSSSISGLFLPRISMMIANKVSEKDLSKLMTKIGRLQFYILGFLLSGFLLYGSSFIKVWAGQEYTEAYILAIIIMIPLTAPLIQNVGIVILQAKNLHSFRAIVTLLTAFFCILGAYLLSSKYGAIGISIALGVTLLIGNTIIMNLYYNIKLKLNMVLFWKNIMKISFIIVVNMIIPTLLLFSMEESIISILLQITLFSLSYILMIYFFAFNSFEKGLIRNVINKLPFM
ncbi:Membrane protein involved in the export of O-antigen and teichoic acid [Terribacillus aidingensis]|uniref:Membrane protein involved in the export of O-antigen and teichoic acid n=1 Tax=Terribacillus aidingensis TaxID=586416 RepID=A0A285N653_9BACI|nr:oligosaccharide flippase family protein [Terribacillus aidingensis]SNZ04788.1 Membrane protein involved in the export of O-antigen and teichoic acid [Terribacillus aidingensis]